MKSIVSFSGGWDSTYILWKLVTSHGSNDLPIECFHLDMSAVEYNHPSWQPGYYADLCAAETIACNKIMEHFGKLARLYTVPIMEVRPGEWVNPQAIRTGASLVGTYDRFIYGACPEMGTTGKRLTWYERMWKEIAPAGKPMEFYLRTINKCRPHAMAEMPAELKALVYSCIKPAIINGKPINCGTCLKCVANTDVAARIANGENPDDVLVYLKQKRGVGAYAGSAQNDGRYVQALAPYLKAGE